MDAGIFTILTGNGKCQDVNRVCHVVPIPDDRIDTSMHPRVDASKRIYNLIDYLGQLIGCLLYTPPLFLFPVRIAFIRKCAYDGIHRFEISQDCQIQYECTVHSLHNMGGATPRMSPVVKYIYFSSEADCRETLNILSICTGNSHYGVEAHHLLAESHRNAPFTHLRAAWLGFEPPCTHLLETRTSQQVQGWHDVSRKCIKYDPRSGLHMLGRAICTTCRDHAIRCTHTQAKIHNAVMPPFQGYS